MAKKPGISIFESEAPGKSEVLNSILEQLTNLASGELRSRVALTGDDDLDAVIVGLNMLAEELEYQESRKQQAEKILHAQNEELALINDFNVAANRGDSLNLLIQLMAEKTADWFSSQYPPAIYLSWPDDQDHLYLQWHAIPSKILKIIRKILRRELPDFPVAVEHILSIKNGRVVNVPRVFNTRSETVKYLQGVAKGHRGGKTLVRPIVTAINIKTLMSVPIIRHHDTVVGAMMISGTQPFLQEDIDRATRLASQMGSIIWRKWTERNLERGENLLAQSQELAQFGSWEIDLKTGNQKWSEGNYHIMGIPPGSPVDQNLFFSLVHPDDLSRLKDIYEKLLKTGDQITTEFRIIHPEKGERFIRSYAEGIKNRKGRIIKILGASQDVTDIKAAVRSLQSGEQRIHQIIDDLPIVLYSVDTDGIITYAAGRGLEAIDIIPEKAIGLSAYDLYGEDSDIAVSLRKAMGGEDVSLKLHYEGRVFEGTFLTMKDGDGEIIGVNIMGVDVTSREELEAEVLKSQKLQSIGELAGGLAHDFNNFLATIGMNIATAKIFVDDSHEVVELLDAAADSVKRATSITQQLMGFTRGGDPVRKNIDMGPFLQEAANFALHGTPVVAKFKFSLDLWCANIDPGQIEQAVDNLLLNSVQAMPNGGTITIRADNRVIKEFDRLGTLKPGEYIVVSISDTGVGIPKDIIGKIFEPYTTTRTGGSGLGLFSAYMIVERHNGWITAKSTEGKGAVFTLYLPAYSNEAPDQKKSLTTKFGSGKVLIMDDEASIRKVLCTALDRLGYLTFTATNGEKAIKLYEQHRKKGDPIDVVILDLTIPGGMGGQQAMVELLELDPNIRAIVASGYADDPVMAKYRDYGFKGMMSKPFDVLELSNVVHDVLNS